MLTLGEIGSIVYGNSVYYFCNISVNLKLFQNKVAFFKKKKKENHYAKGKKSDPKGYIV